MEQELKEYETRWRLSLTDRQRRDVIGLVEAGIPLKRAVFTVLTTGDVKGAD
jgi:hypothetical protein